MAEPQPIISYPLEDMYSIAASIRAFLDEQWQRHMHELYSDPNAFTNGLTPLAHSPVMHASQEVLDEIAAWNHRVKYRIR